MDRPALLDDGARAYSAGDLAAAETAYRTILAAHPTDAETLSNLAATLTASNNPQAAETACRAALAAHPRYWAALANLGNALHRQQRYDEAVNAYHAAIEVNPQNASAWTNLGVALNEQWRMDDSLTAHNAAVALAPNDPQIRANRAMALLIAGDYAKGFAEFEWRWATPGMAPHGLTAPQWRGANPAGKTILLHHEGGFGDTLHFIRYATALSASGATIIARVQTPLHSLLQRSFPSITFLPEAAQPPPHDLQCPLLSLPHAFGTTLENMPSATPYLTPCPAKTAAWTTTLPHHGKKIGLVWAGAPWLGQAQFRAMNARRSIPPGNLAPLANIPGLHVINLQHGAAAAHPPPIDLFDPMPHIADFDDTAALIANLDLVIAVDTAVAHLAGALGKPVWLLSRYDACWRWLANRTSTPWYPSMRIYRQDDPGDWTGVIGRIARDLRHAPPWR
jgi:cytochrome c-type biogenesis protein CcmH/NrfG